MRHTVLIASTLIALAQLAAGTLVYVVTDVLAFGVIAAVGVAGLCALPTLARERTLAVGYVAMSAVLAAIAVGYATDPRFAGGGTTVTTLFVVSVLLSVIFAFSCTYALEDGTSAHVRWSTRIAALPLFMGTVFGSGILLFEYCWRRATELDDAELMR